MSAVGAWHAFAAELAKSADMIERLSAVHRPTVNGRWCRSCTTPGRGTQNTPWPCPIAVLLPHATALREKPATTRAVERPVGL
jgi:hypothetical protein